MYVGRFAPSPTGPLHFGSLVAALASWLDARAARGRWLVRIEDLDAPRTQPGAAEEILGTLQRLGLSWDGTVTYQSTRSRLYDGALHALDGPVADEGARLGLRPLRGLPGQLYWCACTRREIADSSLGLAADGAQIYPGTCRNGVAPDKPLRALRLRTTSEVVRFTDRVQGPQEQLLERDVGDFVLYRADDQYAYQLAVVVDDAKQGVTDVVRGADLLDSTPRQIYLQRLLGYPTPRYLHVPAVVNAAGEKLSKQTGALPIDVSRRSDELRRALAFLGQPDTDELAVAVKNWNAALIPARRALAAAP
jgi:glutamyl-Q tRNA(Asp) synthetase